MAKIQAYIVFKGHVQGVGFRYIAERIASKLGVVGRVKNLYNGDVEIVAEGEQKVIDSFLDNIRNHFSRYIINENVDVSDATGSFDDFQVKF